jgi:uncharacterized OB-fold protein
MSDLRCPQCGARMQPAAQWCSLCHSPTAEAKPALEHAREPETIPAVDPAPKRRGYRRDDGTEQTKRRWIGAIAALAVAAAVTGAIVAWSGSNGDHPAHKPGVGVPAHGVRGGSADSGIVQTS